ncbi:MAG: spore coat protein [Lysinibacillus sp.]|nr:spore coat protein [Lysinibacillus sp.]
MESYYIEITKKNLYKLYKNIWAEENVHGKLTFNNESYIFRISFRGNQLRKHRKKSYHIQFENPFFMDGQHEIHLNAEYNDPSLMRNKLSFDFFNRIGVLAPDSKHVLLFINGNCQGIYLAIESFDEHCLKRRGLPEGSIYYATNDDANFSLYTPEGYIKKTLLDGYTIKHSFQSEDALKKLLIIINTYSKEKFSEEIEKILNVDKYLRWLAGVVCTQNFDGFIHNYALYHNSKTQLFEITPWDYDGSWGRNLHGEPFELEYVPISGYNTLTARLLEISKYKQIYYDVLKNILQEQFVPPKIQPHIEEIQSKIISFIDLDPYIHHKKESVISEKEYILNFIENRNQFLINQLKFL